MEVLKKLEEFGNFLDTVELVNERDRDFIFEYYDSIMKDLSVGHIEEGLD